MLVASFVSSSCTALLFRPWGSRPKDLWTDCEGEKRTFTRMYSAVPVQQPCSREPPTTHGTFVRLQTWKIGTSGVEYFWISESTTTTKTSQNTALKFTEKSQSLICLPYMAAALVRGGGSGSRWQSQQQRPRWSLGDSFGRRSLKSQGICLALLRFCTCVHVDMIFQILLSTKGFAAVSVRADKLLVVINRVTRQLPARVEDFFADGAGKLTTLTKNKSFQNKSAWSG